MVLAREGSRVGGSESFSGVQRSDSDRRCGDLRGRAEELAVAELCARAVQREAGEGRACVSPDVCGDDAIAEGSFATKDETQNTRSMARSRIFSVREATSAIDPKCPRWLKTTTFGQGRPIQRNCGFGPATRLLYSIHNKAVSFD